jgi:hypothetical protein
LEVSTVDRPYNYEKDAEVLVKLSRYIVALGHFCQKHAVSYPMAMVVYTHLLYGVRADDIKVPCKKAKGGLCHIGMENLLGGLDSTLADIDEALEALSLELEVQLPDAPEPIRHDRPDYDI